MSIFDDILQADANAFLNEFAETVLYVKAATKERRPIQAVVDRNPPMPIQEIQGSIAPYIRVSVANYPVTGIMAAELDTGRDCIEILERVGCEQTKTYRIVALEKQDAGMLWLKVE